MHLRSASARKPAAPDFFMNATLRNLSVLGRRHRHLVLLGVALVLAAQWIGVSISTPNGGRFSDGFGRTLMTVALVSSVVIVILGMALYVVLGHVRDSETELSSLAITDHLTGVLSRRGFMSAAGQEFTRTIRYDRPLSFLSVDIDNLKAINERYGAEMGDTVLQVFAAASQSVLRTTDTVGRTGDEEFTIILPETTAARASELAERVRQSCEQVPFDFLPAGETITVSIGVASVGTGDSSIDHALARSDTALRRAKTLGRNRVELG